MRSTKHWSTFPQGMLFQRKMAALRKLLCKYINWKIWFGSTDSFSAFKRCFKIFFKGRNFKFYIYIYKRKVISEFCFAVLFKQSVSLNNRKYVFQMVLTNGFQLLSHGRVLTLLKYVNLISPRQVGKAQFTYAIYCNIYWVSVQNYGLPCQPVCCPEISG